MAKEKLTLATMCDGGVQERIDRCLAKISDNILDLNTDAKKKRTLTIKIALTPNEDDREDITAEVSTNIALAPEVGLKTQFYINKDFKSGMISLTEHAKGQIKGQLTFDDMGYSVDPEEEETPDTVTAEELGCDPKTGEVINEPQPTDHKVVNMRQAGSM